MLSYIPGIVLVGVLAAVGVELGELHWLQSNGISALTLAILLGMMIGNTFYPRLASGAAKGVVFAKQSLLRLGIILYGLRLTFQDIAGVGLKGVIIDSIVLTSTFLLSWWVGTRFFGLDRKTAMLIGVGSSICGAAAVMAAEPVVRGRAEQVTVAVSTVVVFGTVAIFLYPALYHLNVQHPVLSISPAAYGLFTGSTVHEVAQVVAAGRAISDSAANTAVITKMVRVMMLAPFLVLLSICLSRTAKTRVAHETSDAPALAAQPGAVQPSGGRARPRIVIPWFALAFIGVAAINSFGVIPPSLVGAGIGLDTLILAMAMAALGVTTHVSAIRTAGIKPLALASLLFAWLIFGGGAINLLITAAVR
jgi:uncharacterized integral membrane protein (TIGR00698 family)